MLASDEDAKKKVGQALRRHRYDYKKEKTDASEQEATTAASATKTTSKKHPRSSGEPITLLRTATLALATLH